MPDDTTYTYPQCIFAAYRDSQINPIVIGYFSTLTLARQAVEDYHHSDTAAGLSWKNNKTIPMTWWGWEHGITYVIKQHFLDKAVSND